jgi:hypothetical protein
VACLLPRIKASSKRTPHASSRQRTLSQGGTIGWGGCGSVFVTRD